MNRLILILSFICVVCFTARAQVAVKEVIAVTSDPVGTACVAGKIYYNSTTGKNWERIGGVCTRVDGVGAGTVTSVSGTSPINVATGTTTPVVSCATCVTSASALTLNQLVFGAGNQVVAVGDLTGDVTTSGGKATTLASVISAGGPTGSATAAPIITYDAKGRLTTVSSATITPAVGSITGLGTGVATALGVNVGSAGAPILFNGAGGTPSSLVGTNITGTASGLTAGSVTTNANLTGPITSVGNATSIASQTGTGTKFVVDTSPTLVTPTLGSATATKITNAAGSNGAPSYTFTGGTTDGMYSRSPTILNFAVGAAAVVDIANFGGTQIYRIPGDFVFNWSNTAQDATAAADVGLSRISANVLGVGTGAQGSFAGTLKTTSLFLAGKATTYNNITTAGNGVPAIYGSGRVTAQTAAASSIATYTVGASDSSFIVSANVNVTTSTAHTFSIEMAYTDETNTARTVTFNVQQLGGTLVTSITNITGAGPYEGVPLHIRAKASTAITIRTNSGGTYTTVTYNAEGVIQQIM